MKSRARILHVITGLSDGGAEAVLFRLCTHDSASTSHHVVSMTGMGKYGSMLEAKGVRVTCLEMPPGRLKLGALFHLWKLIRNENPDVVQTWMYHANLVAGIIAYLARAPKIFWNIRNSGLDRHLSSRSTVLIAKAGAYLSRLIPARIACCAQRAIETHQKMGYSEKKLVLIPNGYDLTHLTINKEAGESIRQSLALTGASPVIGMVARFNPQKDHTNLLKALRELKLRGHRFQCLLVGRDLDMNNRDLVRQISNLALEDNVLLLGQRPDISSIMNALTVHVLSSAYGEAFPNVVAEAMACGTPVVVTDVGDAGYISGDTGWVVPPRDHIALADAIQEAISQSETERAEKGRLARERILKHFSLSTMIASYHALWVSE